MTLSIDKKSKKSEYICKFDLPPCIPLFIALNLICKIDPKFRTQYDGGFVTKNIFWDRKNIITFEKKHKVLNFWEYYQSHPS